MQPPTHIVTIPPCFHPRLGYAVVWEHEKVEATESDDLEPDEDFYESSSSCSSQGDMPECIDLVEEEERLMYALEEFIQNGISYGSSEKSRVG